MQPASRIIAPNKSPKKTKQRPHATLPDVPDLLRDGNRNLGNNKKNNYLQVQSKDKERVANLMKSRYSTRISTYGNLFEQQPPPEIPPSFIPSDSLSAYYQPGTNYSSSATTAATQDTSDNFKKKYNVNANASNYNKEGKKLNVPQKNKSSQISNGKDNIRNRTTFTAKDKTIELKQNDIDLEPFKNKEFDAANYISKTLGNSSEQEVNEFADILERAKNQTAQEIQANVSHNFNQFMNVASELTNLESEMRKLRANLAELNQTTTFLKDEAQSYENISTPQSVRINSRKSMIELENIYANELASLWKNVKGSQRYLPVTPSRHILKESGAWYELNSTTWKAKQPVHIFLLNDYLLIAIRAYQPHNELRPGTDHSDKAKLSTLHCWPLQEIEITDLKVSHSDGNDVQAKDVDATKGAICVRHVSGYYIYKTKKLQIHAEFLSLYKEAVELLSKKLKRKNDGKANRIRDSMTYMAARDLMYKDHQGIIKNIFSLMLANKDSDAFKPNGEFSKTIQKMDEVTNNIDILIAHRNFEDAVLSIEAAKKFITQASSNDELTFQILNAKIKYRIDELGKILSNTLEIENMHPKNIKQTVKWLLRLEFDEKAKDTLLSSRTRLIRKRIRQIEFHGDIYLYMSQIALVQFTLIKNTVEIYNECFDSRQMSSGIVEWAKEQVEAYAVIFSRQLYSIKPDTKVYQNCIEMTKRHVEQLKSVGLNMNFVLCPLYSKT